MPVYPALALLLGSAMAAQGRWVRIGTRLTGIVAILAAAAHRRNSVFGTSHSNSGDISSALQQHPEVYTLSLGHLGDLTLASFAYLRVPLIVAGIAFVIGALGASLLHGRRAFVAIALMMVLFSRRVDWRSLNSIRILDRGRSPKRSSIPRLVNSFSTASIILFLPSFSTPAAPRCC